MLEQFPTSFVLGIHMPDSSALVCVYVHTRVHVYMHSVCMCVVCVHAYVTMCVATVKCLH